ncbi:MAG: lytic transglycosylase domain-containing protein [Proteobacteria bacterium]|nr:lytic transglycosylase domain-containing protein [Pseudomonadota bacterium]
MRLALFVLLFIRLSAVADTISQLAFRGEIPYTDTLSTQSDAVGWLIPQLDIRSGVSVQDTQSIMEQLLYKPHFPLRDVTNIYILETDAFLHIKDKYLLINYITNYTHFAQSYVDEQNVDPQTFAKIIEEAKNKNHIDGNFINYIKEYYSFYAKLDRKITNTKYGKPVTSEIPKAIDDLTDKKQQAILYSRLFVRGNGHYRKYYDYTEDHNLSSEMLIFDKILYHYERENYDRIAQYIPQLPVTLHNSDIWWNEMQIMLLRLIDRGFKEEAYLLLSRIHLNITHKNYMRKEMLTGAVAMLLQKANHAFENFYNIYTNAKGVDEKSQGAYFIAQSYRKMGNNEAYRYWLEHAMTWPMTFYGTRAIDEYYSVAPLFIMGAEGEYLASLWHKKNEERREIYKKQYNSFIINNIIKNQKSYEQLPKYIVEAMDVAKVMKDSGYLEHAKRFILSAVSHIDDITYMRSLLEHICTEYNKYICADAKQTAEMVGYVDIKEFKTIKSDDIHTNIARNHQSLMHAIIKKESNFKEIISSSAGAKGMMQIMPATARFVCSKHNIKYSYHKLQNDPSYSITLGTLYLNDLLEMYNGSYAKAIAAYNAGYGNVGKWDSIYFKPSNYQESILMIELIPFLETRNYVKKVLMWEGIYGYIFSLKRKG